MWDNFLCWFPVLVLTTTAAFLYWTWTKTLHFTCVGQFRLLVSRSGFDNGCIFVRNLNENAALYICVTISLVVVRVLSWQLLHFRMGNERKCCTLHMLDNFVRCRPILVTTSATFPKGMQTKTLQFTYVGQFRLLVSHFCHDKCCIFVGDWNENAAVDANGTISSVGVAILSREVLHFKDVQQFPLHV